MIDGTQLNLADVVRWCNEYTGEPFHAFLSDVPYHLTEIVRRFGKADATPAQYGTDGVFTRGSRGFMGKTWDGGDLFFQPETWAAMSRVLYPGAFGMAFASSRGWHRMATAMEDAGLLVYPTIWLWTYSTGFPHATRLDTAIDRRAGAKRKVVARRKHQPKHAAAQLGYREKDNGFNTSSRQTYEVTEPATPLAAAWAGHRYGMGMLKPAAEPIIMFLRPYAGKPLDCILHTGAGAIWIDGARIPRAKTDRTEYGIDGDEPSTPARNTYGDYGRVAYVPDPAGRWPANVALVHHPFCETRCHPDCVVAHLEQQSPGATEILYCADWMHERIEMADHVIHCPKPSRAEREAGLDAWQVAWMREMYGPEDEEPATFEEQTVDDGRQKPIDNAYLRGETTRLNTHPTLKPIALARWLSTLLLPPPMYSPRRLFQPCSGTGTEMIGALLAGWENITGVEIDEEHIRIATARLRYWYQRRDEFNAGQPIKVRGRRRTKKQDDGVEQAELFSL
jgi:hypothetical protein